MRNLRLDIQYPLSLCKIRGNWRELHFKNVQLLEQDHDLL